MAIVDTELTAAVARALGVPVVRIADGVVFIECVFDPLNSTTDIANVTHVLGVTVTPDAIARSVTASANGVSDTQHYDDFADAPRDPAEHAAARMAICRVVAAGQRSAR